MTSNSHVRVHSFNRSAAGSLVIVILTAAQVHAQGNPNRAVAGWTQRIDAGIVHQLEADVDGGGRFGMTRAFANADFSHPISADSSWGFGLGGGIDAYDFHDTPAPWEDIMRLDASLSYMRIVAREWAFRFAPSIGLSAEDGASASDSLVYGAVASASRLINPDLRLGIGIAAFSGLEETRAFPFLALQWKISETWTLQNPFRPGPAGPAGLEVVRAGDGWEWAFGGAYRTFRFRLADDGPVGEGIGEYKGVPLFARASRHFDKTWQLDLYGGVVVGGSLEIDDRSGSDLSKVNFDPAPLVALTLSGRF